MVSAWERALQRGEGQAAKSKVKYEDLTPAGRARLTSSVRERSAAMAPPPKPPTPQSAPQRPTRALPTGTPLVPMTRTPSPQEYEQGYKQAGQFAEAALFGPQVESALRDDRQAGYLERFFRTQAGEQEFRTSGERFGEGRPAAGAGWGLLGLAGAIPFFGDIAQGAAGVSRAARGAGAAADVARGAEVGRFGLQVSPLKVGADKAKYTNKLTDLTDVVYREMPFDEFKVVRSNSPSLGGRQLWVSNSPDLALGQGPWPKILVEYDASAFGDVRPGNKPGWQFSWDAGSAEFLVRPDRYSGLREIDAIRSLIIPDETIPTIKRWQLESLSEDFARERIEGGIKFTRKTPTPDVARGAEVGPVAGRNIVNEVSAEISESGWKYTKPNIDSVPEPRRGVAELAYRQGYETKPQVVPNAQFDEIVAIPRDPYNHERLPYEYNTGGRNIVVYRGLRDETPGSAMQYANQFIDGDYWVGKGQWGHGNYFSTDPSVALDYTALGGWGTGNKDGVLMRAMIPADAKLLEWRSNYSPWADDFANSQFTDISEYAIANGYDGIILINDYEKTSSIVALNRSIVSVDDKIINVPTDYAALRAEGILRSNEILDDLFRGGDNLERIKRQGGIPQWEEGVNW